MELKTMRYEKDGMVISIDNRNGGAKGIQRFWYSTKPNQQLIRVDSDDALKKFLEVAKMLELEIGFKYVGKGEKN